MRHRPRLKGESKYGIHNRLWRALADLFAVRWMQRRWIDPDAAEEVEVEAAAAAERGAPR